MTSRDLPNHWVYVVREPMSGCVKVGKSSRQEGIQSRVKSLQTGYPYELEIVATLGPREHPGERVLHTRLAKWRVRPSGEWFYGNNEVYEALGIRRPANSCPYQAALESSFREREANLAAAMELAEKELASIRAKGEAMRDRESELARREKDTLDRMRRVISQELVRSRNDTSEWEQWKPTWVSGDYLLDFDLLRAIVLEAIWVPRIGTDFRRWLVEVAEWRDVSDPWGRIIGSRLRRQLEWLAEHDPDNYEEIASVLRDVWDSASAKSEQLDAV